MMDIPLTEYSDEIRSQVRLFVSSYRRRDRKTMQTTLQAIKDKGAYARTKGGEYLCEYETAVALCTTRQATAALDVLDFDRCIQLAACAYRVLQAKQQRTRKPCSLQWIELLTVLGDAKWKGPREIRDTVMTPAELIEKYCHCENAVRIYIKSHPEYKHTNNENLLWAAAKVLQTTMVYLPDQAPRLMEFIGMYHGNALHDEACPVYWDLKIVFLYVRQQLTEADYQHYTTKRVLAARAFVGEREIKAYTAAVENERKYLLAQMPVRFEVMQSA
jgi:hypothetical protein